MKTIQTILEELGLSKVNSGAEIGGAFGGEKDTGEGGNPVPTPGRPT